MSATRASRSRWAAAPAVLAGGAALALLHATLLRTEPAADATVPEAPAAVRLWFSEAVEAAPDPVAVVGPDGRRVDHGGSVSPEDPSELRAAVSADQVGTYSVRWRVVSDDGHVVEGSYRFDVQRASAPARDEAAASEGGEVPLLTLGRAVHLVGLTLALGALALLLLVPGTTPSALTSRVARLGDVGAIVLMVAAAVMLAAQSAAMQGSVGAGLTHGAIREALHSRWANAWAVRTFAAAALLVVFGLLRRNARPGPGLLGAAVAAGVVLLLATSVNGHAATTAPVWLSVLDDSVHLAATAAWLGGGAALAVLAASARHDEAAFATLRRVVPRFSALALVSVQALIVTGLYQAWAHVEHPALLTQTSYGRALLVKLGFFALLAIPAGLNRLVLKPRFLGAEPADAAGRGALVARFTRLLGVEALVGAGVLGCAALLSALPPAHEQAGAMATHAMSMPMSDGAPPATAPTVVEAPPARLFSTSADGRSLVLSVDPGALGGNQVRVSVRGRDGAPDTVRVALRVVPPDGSGVAPTLIRLSTGGSEHRALLSLGTAGTWTLELLVEDRNAGAFPLDVRP